MDKNFNSFSSFSVRLNKIVKKAYEHDFEPDILKMSIK